jgi:hypothetical protein
MILRQFLYEETPARATCSAACRIRGCGRPARRACGRSSRRRRARRSPIVAVSRRTSKPITSPACPRWSRTGATAYLPPRTTPSLHTRRSPTGETVELGTWVARCYAWSRPPTTRSHRRRQRHRGALARLHRRLAARRRRRTARPARPRRTGTARLTAYPSRLFEPLTTCSSTRATTAGPSAGGRRPGTGVLGGFERRHNAALIHDDEESFVRAPSSTYCPRSPSRRRFSANRRGFAPARP